VVTNAEINAVERIELSAALNKIAGCRTTDQNRKTTKGTKVKETYRGNTDLAALKAV
jgi:hypothetical protein